jgi:hypothetical protein
MEIPAKKTRGIGTLCRRGFRGDCDWILSLEKVAVGSGSFKPERVLIRCVYQDPVRFNVTITRWVPRADEWMVSVVRRKLGASSEALDDFSQFLQVPSSLPHPFNIAGKLLGLRDLLHFSQSLNMASTDSNS